MKNSGSGKDNADELEHLLGQYILRNYLSNASIKNLPRVVAQVEAVKTQLLRGAIGSILEELNSQLQDLRPEVASLASLRS